MEGGRTGQGVSVTSRWPGLPRVDASAVVDALTMPAGTDALRRRLVDEDLHAPHLIDYEVVSVLRGLTRAGQVSAHRAADAFGD
jgi:predicted nucleic acid-binding protein